jgi:hypothetical protein
VTDDNVAFLSRGVAGDARQSLILLGFSCGTMLLDVETA